MGGDKVSCEASSPYHFLELKILLGSHVELSQKLIFRQHSSIYLIFVSSVPLVGFILGSTGCFSLDWMMWHLGRLLNEERREWEPGKRKPKDYYRPMSHRDCRRMIPSGLTEGVWAQSGLEAD